MGGRATFSDFVQLSHRKHGEQYDYSKAARDFCNYQSIVTIICLIHGAFKQRAGNHTHMGHGCIKCRNQKLSSTTEAFIEKAQQIHDQRWDYSRVEYKNSATNVEIGCPDHGFFWQTPGSHIKQQAGCPECAKWAIGRANGRSQEEFIAAAEAIHGGTYDYSSVVYKQQYEEVNVFCHRHGTFSQLPKLHLKGCGCPKCADERGSQKIVKAAAEGFEQKAHEVHGQRYGYDNIEYTGYNDKVSVTCPEHGDFDVKPSKHFQGQGCPQCSTSKMYSDKACDWLDYVARLEGIIIQHARNGREYQIPGTVYKADGYCAQTNTVYEFYGKRCNLCYVIFTSNETKLNLAV